MVGILWISCVLGLQERLGTAARGKSIQRCLQLFSFLFPLWALPIPLFHGRVPCGSTLQILGLLPALAARKSCGTRCDQTSAISPLRSFHWPPVNGISVKPHSLALCTGRGAQRRSCSDSVSRGKLDVNRMMNQSPYLRQGLQLVLHYIH